MEVRILKDYPIHKPGKQIHKCDVPADMHALQKKLEKPLIGVGNWHNTEKKYLTILPLKDSSVFFEEDTLQEIKEWIDSFQITKP